MTEPGFWLPNPRFPAGYREKVERLAQQRGSSVNSLIVNVVLEHVDATLDADSPPVKTHRWKRICGHQPSAPTRVLSSGARVCWCGAVVTKEGK